MPAYPAMRRRSAPSPSGIGPSLTARCTIVGGLAMSLHPGVGAEYLLHEVECDLGIVCFECRRVAVRARACEQQPSSALESMPRPAAAPAHEAAPFRVHEPRLAVGTRLTAADAALEVETPSERGEQPEPRRSEHAIRV